MTKETILKGKHLIKIAFSAILIVILYKMANKENLVSTLNAVHFNALLYIAILYALGQMISVYKWSIIVNSTDLNYDFISLMRAYFFGMFINAAALGTIGGDVARGIFLKPPLGARTKIASSIIVDRIHGLMTLVLVSTVGFAISEQYGYAICLLIALSCVFSLWYFLPGKARVIFHNYPLIRKLTEALDTALPKDKKLLLKITLISASLHTFQIMIYAIIFSEFKSTIPPAILFAFIPLVNIASSLPLSIQGLGVREGLLRLFFAKYDLSLENSIGAGLIWFATVSTISLIAGCWILLTETKGIDRLTKITSN